MSNCLYAIFTRELNNVVQYSRIHCFCHILIQYQILSLFAMLTFANFVDCLFVLFVYLYYNAIIC